MVHSKKNSRQFGEFLEQLVEYYSERRLILVIDNASYHKTKAIRTLLENHCDHVFIV